MGLFDSLTRKVALTLLRRKIDGMRKDGSKVLKILDGWKNRIVVIGYTVAIIAAVLMGQDYRQLADGLLKALGYSGTPADWQVATVIATHMLALWGVIDTVIKAVRQRRAGATWTEIFSTPGFAKQAIKDGVIPPVPVRSEPVK